MAPGTPERFSASATTSLPAGSARQVTTTPRGPGRGHSSEPAGTRPLLGRTVSDRHGPDAVPGVEAIPPRTSRFQWREAERTAGVGRSVLLGPVGAGRRAGRNAGAGGGFGGGAVGGRASR